MREGGSAAGSAISVTCQEPAPDGQLGRPRPARGARRRQLLAGYSLTCLFPPHPTSPSPTRASGTERATPNISPLLKTQKELFHLPPDFGGSSTTVANGPEFSGRRVPANVRSSVPSPCDWLMGALQSSLAPATGTVYSALWGKQGRVPPTPPPLSSAPPPGGAH